ncbi:hypothetical protein PybrP1_012039 [[Pythium] brassicae (nom. inval.)]|nr:hypothetical protein PybrP1_012039 [[Pythium] brassicae (nom. inval.)]
MQRIVQQILRSNFPAVAEKLRKEEPPAVRNAPPPPPPAVASAGSREPVNADASASNGPSTSRDAAMRSVLAAPQAPQLPLTPEGRVVLQLHGYTSESAASETDSTREVDPMDELSDFEPQPSPRASQRGLPADGDHEMDDAAAEDVDMHGDDLGVEAVGEDAEGEGDGEEEEEETACVVCGSSENEDQTLLCDKCDDEYHLYCLNPPLTEVPQEEKWFCPRCAPPSPPPVAAPWAASPFQAAAAGSLKSKDATESTGAHEAPDHTSHLQYTAASTGGAPSSQQPHEREPQQQQQQQRRPPSSQSNGQGDPFGSSAAPPQHQQPPVDPPGTVASMFESDAERSNQLLIHACQCDATKCPSPAFHELCANMKRFLRSACWASHSEQWRGFRVARATAELFAHHAMHCLEPHCSVPMCDLLRGEEVV